MNLQKLLLAFLCLIHVHKSNLEQQLPPTTPVSYYHASGCGERLYVTKFLNLFPSGEDKFSMSLLCFPLHSFLLADCVGVSVISSCREQGNAPTSAWYMKMATGPEHSSSQSYKLHLLFAISLRTTSVSTEHLWTVQIIVLAQALKVRLTTWWCFSAKIPPPHVTLVVSKAMTLGAQP